MAWSDPGWRESGVSIYRGRTLGEGGAMWKADICITLASMMQQLDKPHL